MTPVKSFNENCWGHATLESLSDWCLNQGPMVCIGGILGIGCLDKIDCKRHGTRVFCKTMEVEEIRTSFLYDSGENYSSLRHSNKKIDDESGLIRGKVKKWLAKSYNFVPDGLICFSVNGYQLSLASNTTLLNRKHLLAGELSNELNLQSHFGVHKKTLPETNMLQKCEDFGKPLEMASFPGLYSTKTDINYLIIIIIINYYYYVGPTQKNICFFSFYGRWKNNQFYEDYFPTRH